MKTEFVASPKNGTEPVASFCGIMASAAVPAESARELLVGLRAALHRDHQILPPWSDRLVNETVDEMHDTFNKLAEVAAQHPQAKTEAESMGLCAAGEAYWQYMTYAKRALSIYCLARRDVLVKQFWDPPPPSAGDGATNCTAAERHFTSAYRSALYALADALPGEGTIELTRYRAPPSEDMLRLRVEETHGEVMTEEGPMWLVAGAVLNVRSATAEALLRLSGVSVY